MNFTLFRVLRITLQVGNAEHGFTCPKLEMNAPRLHPKFVIIYQ